MEKCSINLIHSENEYPLILTGKKGYMENKQFINVSNYINIIISQSASGTTEGYKTFGLKFL